MGVTLQGATVRIGKFDLCLTPLEQKHCAFATDTVRRLRAFHTRRASEEWKTAIRDALGCVFLSSRKNHPKLSLAELHDTATQEQVVLALGALSDLTGKNVIHDAIKVIERKAW